MLTRDDLNVDDEPFFAANSGRIAAMFHLYPILQARRSTAEVDIPNRHAVFLDIFWVIYSFIHVLGSGESLGSMCEQDVLLKAENLSLFRPSSLPPPTPSLAYQALFIETFDDPPSYSTHSPKSLITEQSLFPRGSWPLSICIPINHVPPYSQLCLEQTMRSPDVHWGPDD
ncbi:hypothetical protein PNOK_0034900 [Pyrrhoderma noxium]|uniref:Uncharacterized protein n=1 Tax=Pyrrhoderma noxium TaxID=2282107 RepID=A0A286UUM8_9AGAM|nr:hypothetical protein PNOK_0034900 [Pyrrhoderma noxium]